MASAVPRAGPSVLDALSLLAEVADELVVRTVRDTHVAVLDRTPAGTVHRGITTAVYGGLTRGLGGASRLLDRAAATGMGPRLEADPRGRFLNAAVNGLIGDRLVRERPQLAIPMAVRRHGAPEPHTLDDYRIRHALYKTDPGLQAAHAAAPWIVTWDDHEVSNDYADDRSAALHPRAWFLERRAAAYRAYYEHMPLPRRMVPFGPHLRLYHRAAFGELVQFHVLDDRQFRSPQPCAPPISRWRSRH